MKVQIKIKLKLPNVKKRGIVYCSYREGAVIVARRYVRPKPSEQNSRFASLNANLFKIAPSEAYKKDLRVYINRHNASPQGLENPLRSWNNLYIKLMSALAKKDKSIDLSTLTREEIYERKLPCISLSRAVEAGLLPKVKGWNLLISEI